MISSAKMFQGWFFFIILPLLGVMATVYGDLKVLSYTQKLDHFGQYKHFETTTFQQKVVVNDKLWGGANNGAPIIALLGNELGQTFDPNIYGILALSAVEFKAMLVHIEHRFYGESVPFESIELAMEDKDVRGCLSTDQALQDFAEIIQSLKANHSAFYSPVIVVGIGYGGALATWFRLKYPELAIGALASSTPILYYGNTTQPDGYCEIVGRNFEEANPKCHEAIRKSWKTIDQIVDQPNGLAALSKTFNTCRPLHSPDEIIDKLGELYSFVAQHDDHDHGQINTICKYAVSGTIQGIVEAIYVYMFGQGCFDSTLTGSNSPFEPSSNITIAWAWQRCSELIFPVGCSYETMLPRKPFHMADFERSCQERFGIVPNPHTPISFFASRSMVESLTGFGGNIIFSNGLRDPFCSGAILEDLSDTIISITRTDGVNSNDINTVSDADPESLRWQREEELKIFRKWLNHYNHIRKRSNTLSLFRDLYIVACIVIICLVYAFLLTCIFRRQVVGTRMAQN